MLQICSPPCRGGQFFFYIHLHLEGTEKSLLLIAYTTSQNRIFAHHYDVDELYAELSPVLYFIVVISTTGEIL